MPTRVERAAEAIAAMKYQIERELRKERRYILIPIADLIQDVAPIIAQNLAMFLAEVHNEGYRRGEDSAARYPRGEGG